MIDRFLAPALTFTMLVAATLAMAAAMLEDVHGSAAHQAAAGIVTLPMVTITGKRVQSVAQAPLPQKTALE